MSDEVKKAKPVNTRVVKQNISDQTFMIALCVVAGLFIPFLYYSQMINAWCLENRPAGYKVPEYKQLWMTGVGALSFGLMKEMIDCIAYPICSHIIVNKGDDYAYERKVRKACENIVGLCYFSLSTFWGWSMMKDSKWLPHFLGGQHPEGSMRGSFDVLFGEVPPGIHCYILFTYGYHVQDLVRHLFFVEKDNDWREMVLHHLAALALYPGFIFANVLGVGTVICWLHDLGDILVNTTRLCNLLDWHTATAVTFLANMILWFYTRLLILPTYIYLIVTEIRFPEPVTHFQPIIWIEMVFLMCMQCLHVFWFGLFLQMGYRLVTKGERKDVITTLDDKVGTSKKVQ